MVRASAEDICGFESMRIDRARVMEVLRVSAVVLFEHLRRPGHPGISESLVIKCSSTMALRVSAVVGATLKLITIGSLGNRSFMSLKGGFECKRLMWNLYVHS